jgi:hypothetical protein
MKAVFLLAGLLALALPAQGQTQDPVEAVLTRLSAALNSTDRAGFPALFSLPQADIDRLSGDLSLKGAVRTVVRLRDRAPLEGVPPGDGFQLVVDFFIEASGRARIVTAGLAIRRPAGGALDSWRIVASEGLSFVDGVYRLRLDLQRPLAARNLTISSEDVSLTLEEGTVFPVECDDGTTGLVIVGRGEMRFAPAPAAEKGQLQLFADTETLVESFETAFIRLSPSDYRRRIAAEALTPVVADRRVVRRAQEVFERESPKSYGLELQEYSRDNWHLLPMAGDFLAEVNTRRYDTLTYLLSSAQAEDISLFQREQRRTISLYASKGKIAARGRFYSEDALRDYDILDYNIDASVTPDRQAIDGRARLSIRIRSASLTTLTLRLAEPLVVSGVTSVEYGRLLHLRVRGQNTVLVNLPRQIQQDADLTLIVSYAGRLPSQQLDMDTLQTTPARNEPGPTGRAIEQSYLLSNQSLWYPQNPVADYSTATLRLSVPEAFDCIASGQPVSAGGLVSLRDLIAGPGMRAFTFRANQPLRYFAFVVSRFTRVASSTVAVGDDPAIPGVAVAVDANPRQQARGRQVMRATEEILKYYASLMHGAPFASATVAVIESELPGGHSPGYLAVLNEPMPNPDQAVSWRNDPAAFEGFADFFLAHELAHQWWGQAVGWKNYHEQWISEGFAQYFAALYAAHSRGDRVFVDMLRQFRRWSLSESDQGPVYLGYRLGHIQGTSRVYRAIVYNKGAAVLHMLRRYVGDEAFFSALRRFYDERKYQKAGTDDVQRAFELESGRDLARFFERWIYGTGIPQVTYRVDPGATDVTLRFAQAGSELFDIPVTVSIVYADGRTEDVVVTISEASVERKIPTKGAVREVQVNRDSGALAEFKRQ